MSEERARLHFEAGRAAFDEGDYEAAIREFRESYDLSHRPELLFNLASPYERLGDFGQAADLLEQYLGEADNPNNRVEVERRIVRLRERAAQAVESSEPEVVAPEPHDERQVVASRTEIDPVPALIAYAVGVAGFGAFGVMGGLTVAEYGNLEERCGNEACSEEDLGDLQTFSIVADIGLGVGIAGAAVGTLLLLVVQRDVEDSDVAIVPTLDPTQVGLAARGSF